MKIVKKEGSTSFGIIVDGVPFEDMEGDQQISVVQSVCDSITAVAMKDPQAQLWLLLDTLTYDEYDFDGDPCDSDGAIVSTTTWEL